jgi:hypothetical protein
MGFNDGFMSPLASISPRRTGYAAVKNTSFIPRLAWMAEVSTRKLL